MTEWTLRRHLLGERTTLGVLWRGDVRECFILEDRFRPGEAKVPGATAIPLGRYRVEVTYSPRFKVRMPLLHAVPGFKGIRIHPGTTHEDTAGCLLTGTTARAEWDTDDAKMAVTYHLGSAVPVQSARVESRLVGSRQAYEALLPLMSSGEHWLTVTLA